MGRESLTEAQHGGADATGAAGSHGLAGDDRLQFSRGAWTVSLRCWRREPDRLGAHEFIVVCTNRVGLAQALDAGLSRSAIHRKLRNGSWTAERPRVYVLAGASGAWEQQAMAALLWAGPDAVLSHRSAARLWGLDSYSRESQLFVTCPRNLRSDRKDDVLNRAAVDRRDRGWVRPFRTTSPERLLLDLAATESPERLESVLDELLRRRLVSTSKLALRLAEGSRLPGTASLRKLLDERRAGLAPSESPLEVRFYRFLEEAGAPLPGRQHRVFAHDRCIARLDMAYPERRVGLEVDGKRFHFSEAAYHRDKRRDTELMAVGWRILRFTALDLKERPEWILERIHDSLRLAT